MERIVFAIKTSHYAIKTNKLSSKVWSNPSGQQNYSTSPRNRVWNLEVYNLTNFPFFDLMETLIFLYLSTKICNNNNEYKCTNVSYHQARALRALGLLLADGTPTVGGGKTF